METLLLLGLVALLVAFLAIFIYFSTKFPRVIKIFFVICFTAFSMNIYNQSGIDANFVWLCCVWLVLVLSFGADRLYANISKWDKQNLARKSLFKNIYAFNLICFIGFFIYALMRENGAYIEYGAYFAFAMAVILYVIYVRLKFITNAINVTKSWAMSVDSQSYALVGSVLERFKEKDNEDKLEKLKAIIEATLQELNQQGIINMKTLGGVQYIFGDVFYKNLLEFAVNIAKKSEKIAAKDALTQMSNIIQIDNNGLDDLFILTQCVNKYVFGTSEYYIHNIHLDKFIFCESCGGAKKCDEKLENVAVWYCSKICEDSELKCLAISEALNPTMQEGESQSEYEARVSSQREEFFNIAQSHEDTNQKLSFELTTNEILEKYRDKINITTNYKANIERIDNAITQKIPKKSLMQEATDSKNISNATTATIGNMEVSNAWGDNFKALSNPEAGHGDMAELMNHQHDKYLSLKKAELVGKDNAPKGADRIVDGQEIQSKYYKTATKTINSMFDNKGSGEYAYYDKNGKPMQLEVPSDQYDSAVKIMEQKIADGKVPGVTDPKEAKNIVRKGNYTLEEAKNACKFFTKESLKYDFINGTVVALKAGGIAFIINTCICYYRNGDIKESLRQSFIIGLQTGGKTFAIYMVGAQLQRLPAFNAFMKELININFAKGGYVGEGLAKMAGRQAGDRTISVSNAANSTLRATAVAAVATLAVTSSIEVVQMARGKISGMQCVKNIFVNAGGIAGGAAGALAGAVALSFIPVVGTVAGGFIGGMLGGMLGSGLAKKGMDNFIEDDLAKKYRIFYWQMIRLSMVFKLSSEEMSEFSATVDDIVSNSSEFFGSEFSVRNMLPYANSILKPIVVMIISKRPKLPASAFDTEYIQEVIAEEVA